MNVRALGTICVAATLAAVGGAAHAAVTINLGASSQDYVLYGRGPVAPNQGSFTNQQGSESYNSGTNTTTDTLSGSITGSSDPGLASGSYAFVTTYTGGTIGSGGHQIESVSSTPGSDFFFYSALDSSVDMTLFLTGTPSGAHTLPMFKNGVFDAGFSFAFVDAVCTNVPSCDQNLVGLTPGATESSPSTIFVSVASVPEPAAWAMMLMGLGLVGAGLRIARRRDVTALTTG